MYENYNLNIVNVNGREFWVDDPDSFYEMCAACGVSKEDVNAYTEEAHRPLTTDAQDGLLGDEYYSFLEAIGREADDLESLAEALDERSCKGNTRADIARSLRSIVANLRYMM